MTVVAVSLIAYLVGSVSPAYRITRLVKGVDIRDLGSGNPGAVNVFREVGGVAGAAVLAVDALKGDPLHHSQGPCATADHAGHLEH